MKCNNAKFTSAHFYSNFSNLEPFPSDRAKIWRSANYALVQAVKADRVALNIAKALENICLGFVSAIPGTAIPCTSKFH